MPPAQGSSNQRANRHAPEHLEQHGHWVTRCSSSLSLSLSFSLSLAPALGTRHFKHICLSFLARRPSCFYLFKLLSTVAFSPSLTNTHKSNCITISAGQQMSREIPFASCFRLAHTLTHKPTVSSLTNSLTNDTKQTALNKKNTLTIIISSLSWFWRNFLPLKMCNLLPRQRQSIAIT